MYLTLISTYHNGWWWQDRFGISQYPKICTVHLCTIKALQSYNSAIIVGRVYRKASEIIRNNFCTILVIPCLIILMAFTSMFNRLPVSSNSVIRLWLKKLTPLNTADMSVQRKRTSSTSIEPKTVICCSLLITSLDILYLWSTPYV